MLCWALHHLREIKKMLVNTYTAAAAAAAKSLQSYLTLCNPINSSPPGSSVPGILQTKILEWVAISFSNAYMHAYKVALVVSNSV